jgi:protein-S-isoprenylcysteine O-methyltransferase Ste14
MENYLSGHLDKKTVAWMEIQNPTQPGQQRTGKLWRDRLADLLIATLWGTYGILLLMAAFHQRQVADFGLFLFYSLTALCFLRRRPARHQGAWWELVLAFAATIAPLISLHPAANGWSEFGSAMQYLGIAGILWSLASLGRSFGIAPADRGLVASGPYRLIRHPLYTTELFCLAGFVVANMSWTNLAALLLMIGLQVFRITREERIIDNYGSYATRVRWRLVPRIW